MSLEDITVSVVAGESMPSVQVTAYNKEQVEQTFCSPGVLEEWPRPHEDFVTWLHIDGWHEPELLKSMGEAYQLHHLLLEDVQQFQQRPKSEPFGETLLIVIKQLFLQEDGLDVIQCALILKEKMVISIQDKESTLFDGVNQRILMDRGRVRKRGSDYLLYALVDSIVDQNLLVIEQLEERCEVLEEVLMKGDGDSQELLEEIYDLRKQIVAFRRWARPTRDLVRSLIDDLENNTFMEDKTKSYLLDIYDHTSWIADGIDSTRERIRNMLDLHMSQANNRMNEVMKVLAIISTIFMPLNLVAAVYGMNFKYMPELEIKGFYFLVIGGMVGLSGAMLWWFRKKRWI